MLGKQPVQFKPVDAVDTEVVLNLRRRSYLPAAVVQHRRTQPRARSVQRCGQSGRTAAENEEIIKLCIHKKNFPFPFFYPSKHTKVDTQEVQHAAGQHEEVEHRMKIALL